MTLRLVERVKHLGGCDRMTSGAPSSTMTPSSTYRIRFPTSRAKPSSRVTTIIAIPLAASSFIVPSTYRVSRHGLTLGFIRKTGQGAIAALGPTGGFGKCG
jgi:hypothetical protein